MRGKLIRLADSVINTPPGTAADIYFGRLFADASVPGKGLSGQSTKLIQCHRGEVISPRALGMICRAS